MKEKISFWDLKILRGHQDFHQDRDVALDTLEFSSIWSRGSKNTKSDWSKPFASVGRSCCWEPMDGDLCSGAWRSSNLCKWDLSVSKPLLPVWLGGHITVSMSNISATASCYAPAAVLWTGTWLPHVRLHPCLGGTPGPSKVTKFWVTLWDLSVPSSLAVISYLPTQCCMKTAKKCMFARKAYFQ